MEWVIVLKNKIKMQRILSIIFILFSLCLTVFIAIFFNIGINRSFDKYLVSKNQQLVRLAQDSSEVIITHNQGQNPNPPNRNMQLNSIETDLKRSINNYIIIIGFLSFGLSILVAFLVTKRVTKPLSKIEEATRKIEDGDYNLKIKENTSIEEISNLITALESMAKKINDNLEHDKRISQDVQHELRTPLTNLKAQVEAMLDGVWDIDESNLNLCLSEINRLNNIVNQLYQLGMIENEDIIDFSNVNLKELVDFIIFENSLSLEEKNMEVKNNIKSNSIIISDEVLIKSAIFNLITNSIKYSGEKSTIQVNLSERNKNSEITTENEKLLDRIEINKDYYIIEIIDNGIGIPKDKINQIFERFYRVDKSRSRKQGGAGLGLSIVSAIANKLGGFIFVESEENVVTKFSLYIEKMVIK